MLRGRDGGVGGFRSGGYMCFLLLAIICEVMSSN